MKQCEKCLFYSKDRDELGQKFDDTSDRENHFCSMYDDHIPDDVVNDQTECEYCLDKQI